MDYMLVIWIVVLGAIILSALIMWSVGETRRHQQRGRRGRKAAQAERKNSS